MIVHQHNRMAAELAEVNPHWGDETLFQEARHINAALIQHITFNEYLPLVLCLLPLLLLLLLPFHFLLPLLPLLLPFHLLLLLLQVLGRRNLHRHGLVLYTDGHFDGYDPMVNPSAAQGFTTAAYRFGHSLLPSTIERWSPSHRFIGTQKLSEMLQQPYDLFKPGWADHYVLGMVNQVAQAMDDSVTSEVTNHLFEEPGEEFGLDLAALNLQRGREHGIPSYPRYREWCGLGVVASWGDLAGVMANQTVAAYQRLYDSPADLDLWSAGVVELPEPGALVGPTFACIIGRQFHNLRFLLLFLLLLLPLLLSVLHLPSPPSLPTASSQVRRQIFLRARRLAEQLHPGAAPGDQGIHPRQVHPHPHPHPFRAEKSREPGEPGSGNTLGIWGTF